jgi:predicted porin
LLVVVSRTGLPQFELRGEISIMQKKLIALAIAGLGSFAGAAHADDSLTLYGLIDAGVGSYSHIGPASQTASGFQAGGLTPNLWGMKGSEDLGNGTKAVFGLEGSMSPANGAIGGNSNGNLFGREAYVGLDSSSWGSLKAGLFIDPYLIAVLITDPNDLTEVGSALNTYVFSQGISQIYNSAAIGIFDPNAIQYHSPEFGGVFNFTLLYGFGGVAGNTSALRYFSGNAVYHTGPFLADFAYFDYNNVAGQNQDKAWHLGGSYKLNDAFKFYLAYDDSKTPLGLGATFPLNSPAVTENTQWGGGFGGNITPAIGYSVGYYRETAKNDSSDRATTLGVILTYKLSKHTKFYAAFDQLKSGTGIINGYASTNAPGGGLVFYGQSSTGFTLGLNHSF